MEEIFSIVYSNINVLYIVMCNVVTYIIIDAIQNGNKKKKRTISKLAKRGIATFIAIFMAFCMLILEIENNENIFNQLFYSFFIQFLTWDYCFKSVITFLKNKFGNASEE